MTAATIFENRKKSPYLSNGFDWSSRNLARWRILASWRIGLSSLPTVENSTFQKSNMAHGRRLNNRKISICR